MSGASSSPTRPSCLPRYLRFVRGIVDSADLPLNVSREMIQESPLLASIRKGVTDRILGDLGEARRERCRGLRQDLGKFRRRAEGRALRGLSSAARQLLKLARFRSTTSGEGLRSLADYVAAMKEGQKAIFYMTGDDRARLEASPQLEGFKARGRRGPAADRSGRQLLGDGRAAIRRQAVQVGDAGRG